MLGYAATTDVRNVPTGRRRSGRVEREPRAGQPIRRLTELRRHRGARRRFDEVDAYLDTGTAWMALDIPAGYGERIRAGRPTTVQVVADGTDANSTNVALGTPARSSPPMLVSSRSPVGSAASATRLGRRPRLVQPAAREQGLHDPRHPGAAAARRDHEPVVDVDRARKGARHAGAVECHADRPLGVDRRASCCRTRSSAWSMCCWSCPSRLLWFEVPLRGSLRCCWRCAWSTS